jgi:hypothetical protein
LDNAATAKLGATSEKIGTKQRWMLAGALLFVYFTYVACFLGIVGSNDGSHFALTKAMAEQGRYQIGDGRVYALGDVATAPGSGDPKLAPQYSNKPPGTALLCVPFYWVGRLADGLLTQFPPPDTWTHRDESRLRNPFYIEAQKYGYPGRFPEFRAIYRGDWPRQNSVNLSPALAGVACCALIYVLARQLGAGFGAALVAMLLAALGTLQWRYSTAPFAHVYSAAILLGQIYWLATRGAWRSTVGAFGWGALVGYSGLVEYQALLTAPLVGVYWLWHAVRELGRPVWIRRLGAAALGAMIPLGYLAWYQYTCFGDPLQTTVTRSVFFDYAESPGSMLTGTPNLALRCLFFGSPSGAPEDYKGQGLVKTSPILLVAVVGWFFIPKGSRLLALVVALIVVSHTAVIAQVRAPMGGATYDARYLLRVVPLAVVGLALLCERAKRVQTSWRRWTLWAFLALLALASVVNAVDMMGKFQRHDIFLPGYPSKVNLLYRLIVCVDSVGNWPQFLVALEDLFRAMAYLTNACFANVGNGPMFLVAAVVAGLVSAGLWGGRALAHARG